MKHRYLEVTFRKDKPLAAYLYLPRPSGSRAARTLDAGHGVCVDVQASGTLIGIEITAPGAVTVAEINAILVKNGIPELADDELAPLAACSGVAPPWSVPVVAVTSARSLGSSPSRSRSRSAPAPAPPLAARPRSPSSPGGAVLSRPTAFRIALELTYAL